MNGTLSYVFAILFMSNKFKAYNSYHVYHVQHVLETEVRCECEESLCGSFWEGWKWYCRHSTWFVFLRISSKGFLMEPQNIWGVPQSNTTGKTCKNIVLKKYKISNPKLDVERRRSMTSWETLQTEQINVFWKKSRNIDAFNSWILTFYRSLLRIF